MPTIAKPKVYRYNEHFIKWSRMATKLRSKNAAGIWFWLKWILTTIGGFLVSLFFWNWILFDRLKSNARDPHVAIGWMVAVFGTWFVTLIPMMKKKETVMGHMDKQDESTVTWWLIWISLTIGTFFIAVWLWTPFISARFGSVKNPTTTFIWIVAVFGSWLVTLIPLMVLMYWKVDKAYEDARIRRQMGQTPFENAVKLRAVFVEKQKRRISDALSQKLKTIPRTIKGGHLVTAILQDGRRMDHVFVSGRKELLGIYDQQELTFEANDIVDVEPTDLTHPPDFTQKTWLRLDGNSA